MIYLSHTRPDIAYAASIVIHLMQNTCSSYVEVVFRILRYLKSPTRKGILFSNNNHLHLEGYIDADCAGSIDERRSTSGYCTFVGGNPVTFEK